MARPRDGVEIIVCATCGKIAPNMEEPCVNCGSDEFDLDVVSRRTYDELRENDHVLVRAVPGKEEGSS